MVLVVPAGSAVSMDSLAENMADRRFGSKARPKPRRSLELEANSIAVEAATVAAIAVVGKSDTGAIALTPKEIRRRFAVLENALRGTLDRLDELEADDRAMAVKRFRRWLNELHGRGA